MADQFQYIKLPDGSYGKFAADASDATIRGAVEKDFPDAFNAKPPSTPVPAGLSGPQDPEYKPFLSAGNLLDEGSGILKAGAGAVSPIAHAVSHIPGAYNNSQRQGMADLDEYARPMNKGETFGKVVGTAGLALPAILSGGEFAGGLYDELSPVVSPAMSAASGALGRVAGTTAKNLIKGAGYGVGSAALGYGIHKLKELF